MGLKDVGDQLYHRKKGSREKREFFDMYNVEKNVEDIDSSTVSDESSSVVEDALNAQNRKKAWTIGVLALAVIIVLVSITFGVVQYRQEMFQEDRVMVEVGGLDTIESNQRVKIPITYENTNRVSLTNAALEISYPDVFLLEESENMKKNGLTGVTLSLGTLEPGARGTVDVYGTFAASEQKTIYMNAALIYSPEHISSLLRQETQKGIHLKASVTSIELTTPLEISAGEMVEFTVQYTNNGRQPLYGLRLQMRYPDDFYFQEADEAPSEGDNVWHIGVLGVEETQTLRIRGRLNGEKDAFKGFRAIMGTVGESGSFTVLAESQSQIHIIGSPFSITQDIDPSDGIVEAGETMQVRVLYTNEGDIGLRDAVVTAELGGDILYDKDVDPGLGSFSESTRTITWRASDVADLGLVEPGGGGTISFSVPIRNTLTVESETERNFLGSVLVSIDSKDVPDRVGSARVVAKNWKKIILQSDTNMSVIAQDKDSGEPIEELEMKPGKEVTFRVDWEVSNVYNDVENVRAELSLPSGIEWAGALSDEGESVAFNDRSQQLIWEIGLLKNGAGAFLPKRSVSFLVRVTPQEYQRSGTLFLLHGIKLTGTDAFTGRSVTIENARVEGNVK